MSDSQIVSFSHGHLAFVVLHSVQSSLQSLDSSSSFSCRPTAAAKFAAPNPSRLSSWFGLRFAKQWPLLSVSTYLALSRDGMSCLQANDSPCSYSLRQMHQMRGELGFFRLRTFLQLAYPKRFPSYVSCVNLCRSTRDCKIGDGSIVSWTAWFLWVSTYEILQYCVLLRY